MVHSFEQIAEEAARLTRYSKRKTLTAREVQVSGRFQQGLYGRLAVCAQPSPELLVVAAVVHAWLCGVRIHMHARSCCCSGFADSCAPGTAGRAGTACDERRQEGCAEVFRGSGCVISVGPVVAAGTLGRAGVECRESIALQRLCISLVSGC
jgi:hypothetical protein